MKYLLFLSYIGTSFSGVQKNKPIKLNDQIVYFKSVAGEIERAWLNAFPETKHDPPQFFPSSRTDKGVHAIRSSMHVWFPEDKTVHNPINEDLVTKKLNKHLNQAEEDIRIIDTHHVSETFDSQKLPISRSYLYRLGVHINDNGRNLGCLKFPFSEWNRTHFFGAYKFDVEKIQEAAKLFLGEKDYFAVMGRPSHKKEHISTIKNITQLDFKSGKPLMPDYDPHCQYFSYYDVICSSKSFLYRQVRRIVSVLIAVGEDKITLDDVKLLFDKPEPSSWKSAIEVVPAHGLYLLDVRYKEEDLAKKNKIVNQEKIAS